MSVLPASSSSLLAHPGSVRVTSYYGEADRAAGRHLSDRLGDIYAEHRVHASVVLRGSDGFGIKHHLQSDQVEVLSLDLPVVSFAVDSAARIGPMLDDIAAVQSSGIITVEEVGVISPWDTECPGIPGSDLAGDVKVSFFVGRQDRTSDGRLAARAVVEELHRHGAVGATVLAGVDGTARRERARAEFFSANRDTPVVVHSVGGAGPMAAAVHVLTELLDVLVGTVEPVRICRREGQAVAGAPERVGRPSGWQALTVYGSLADRWEGRPVHQEIVRQVRDAGGAGATSVHGVWGFHGDHAPHGDRVLRLGRRIPVVTTVIDKPDVVARIYPIIDRLTEHGGLVTSRTVHALHRSAAEIRDSGERLAGTQ